MEQTFMTIHNLTPDANVLFASESIADILGYQPAEVQGKSCFDFFHPEEVPFARSIHSRGVRLDKAAVLHYGRILSRDGRWIGCECCFTIVHDVLVACVSIYHRGAKSSRRAIEAPQIRRIFSCSPRDPRYHMLEHLSPKFKMSPTEREPRAALILNRFTRNLTVMFATNATTAILGLRPDQIKNKSFYRCIQESCLPDAIKCIESAKANDSIAYLRFSFQDPRDDEELEIDSENEAEYEDTEQGGASASCKRFNADMEMEMAMDIDSDNGADVVRIKTENDEMESRLSLHPQTLVEEARASGQASRQAQVPRRSARSSSIELEAVVSCTSDGLVVVLRTARPPIPPAHPPLVAFNYGDGLFAAPWAHKPIRPHFPVESLCTFRPPLLPQYMPLRDNVKDAGGPPLDVLMGSIRDVAVFAWGVVGINPGMAVHSRGLPSGHARPKEGTHHQKQHEQQADNDHDLVDAGNASSIDKGKAVAAVPDERYGDVYTSTAFGRRGSCGLPAPINSASSFGSSTSRPISLDYMHPRLPHHNVLEGHPGAGITSPNLYGPPGMQWVAPFPQPTYGISAPGSRPNLGSSASDHHLGWR